MKIALLVLLALVVLVAFMAIVGALLPRAHVATRAATFKKSPAQLYGVVRDFAGAPRWRTGLKSVELLPPRDGQPCYRETTSHGAITYVVREDRAGEKLISEIADRELPFGGTWTFEFAARSDGASTLRITERGEVKNVFFRFLARFAFGYTRTIEAYLRDLGRKFDEQTEPVP